MGASTLFFWFLVFGFWFPAFAKNGAFKSTKHGKQLRCAQCHDHHGSAKKHDNDFCFACHANRSDDGVWPGNVGWWRSVHATRGQLCVDCHDPHGVKDSGGLVPSLLDQREPQLCLKCHDGSRATRDLATEMAKPFRHPFERKGHDPAAESEAKRSAAMGINDRHAVCSDCHNVHAGLSSVLRPPSSLNGVSRVEVLNGPAGVAPHYVWRSGDESTSADEYQVCFKCHSSWTRQPPGQPDLALLTNPANASYHPIQAQGRNRIDPAAFANGLTSESMIFCSDCHTAHASDYRFLVKKEGSELCFDCHARAVYAGGSNATRFAGHALHAGAQQIACNACHESHGSARFPALIARKFPGITTYSQTTSGGTCASSCHAPKTYALTYPR